MGGNQSANHQPAASSQHAHIPSFPMPRGTRAGWWTGKWSSVEEVRAAWAPKMATLQPAQMKAGALVRLDGYGGIFSPVLLNPAWFEGRMTEEEWRQIICEINERSFSSYVGCKRRIHVLSGGKQWNDAEDVTARIFAHVLPFVENLSAWWREHRGINIVCTMGTPLASTTQPFQEITFGSTLYFALLPMPADGAAHVQQRAMPPAYALLPPISSALASSAEGQSSQDVAGRPRGSA